MLKLLYCYIVILLVVFAMTPVLALNMGTDIAGKAATAGGYAGTTSDTTLAETVGLIISIVLAFVGVIFLVLMVYAGILWMTAAGEEEKIKKAQKIIITSLVGLLVTVGAYAIAHFIVPALLSIPTAHAVEVKDSAMGQINAAVGKVDIGNPAEPQMVVIGIINIVLGFVGTIFVCLIVYGGFLMFTAQGEEEKAKKGAQIIQSSIIGLIIVLLSYAITYYIGTRVNPLVSQGGVVEK